MLSVPPSVKIFLYGQAADLRRGYDGLAAIVKDAMGEDPLSGSLFIFVNQRGNRIKLLYWDRAPEVSGRTPGRSRPGHHVDNVCVTVAVWSATVPRGYVDEVCDSSARKLPRECGTLAMLCSLGSPAR